MAKAKRDVEMGSESDAVIGGGAVTRLTVENKALRRLVRTARAGAKQGVLGEVEG